VSDDRERFGAEVIGPVMAEFAQRLWLFARALPENSQLLFCARGGLRLRRHFEQFLAQIGETLPVPCDDLMASRLAVVRGALLAQAPAAFDEIAREFQGATLASALAALSQQTFELPDEWRAPFEPNAFARLLESDAAAAARGAIAEQAALFDAHFQQKRRGEHIVLCDTGLYGSTLRLLRATHPEVELSCVMLARANYKNFASEHFERTAGLIVERNAYSPFDVRSVVLRYWQLIEHICEPPLDSVKVFARSESGEIKSNLERPGWREAIEPAEGELFAGALSYLSQLNPGNYSERLFIDVPRAWRELKRRILWPSPGDRDLLAIGVRGRDFGRAESVDALAPGLSWVSLKASLWREGAVAGAPFGLRTALQAALEGAQLARQLRRKIAPRRRAFAGAAP
jgi:hypothetical protein